MAQCNGRISTPSRFPLLSMPTSFLSSAVLPCLVQNFQPSFPLEFLVAVKVTRSLLLERKRANPKLVQREKMEIKTAKNILYKLRSNKLAKLGCTFRYLLSPWLSILSETF